MNEWIPLFKCQTKTVEEKSPNGDTITWITRPS